MNAPSAGAQLKRWATLYFLAVAAFFVVSVCTAWLNVTRAADLRAADWDRAQRAGQSTGARQDLSEFKSADVSEALSSEMGKQGNNLTEPIIITTVLVVFGIIGMKELQKKIP